MGYTIPLHRTRRLVGRSRSLMRQLASRDESLAPLWSMSAPITKSLNERIEIATTSQRLHPKDALLLLRPMKARV